MNVALNFSGRRRVPVVLQSEAAECGIACLCMIASYHGHDIDLASMRAKYSISLKGTTLADIMKLASELKLAPRPLRAELEHFADIQLPCVLHWDFNHFVVLVRVTNNQIVIHDPATGLRQLTVTEFSQHFTGIALELTPTHEFSEKIERQHVKLRTLVGRIPGLSGTLTQIILLALALQVFSVIGPFYMQWVVDEALVSRDRDLVAVLGVGFLLLALIQVVITGLRAWVLMVVGTTLNLHMVSNLFRHLIRLPMNWFDKRHLGDITSRFDSMESIQRTLTTSFLEALIDGVMVVITLGLMLFYSVQLASVAIVAAMLYTGLRIALFQPMRLATEEHIVRYAKQQSHFLETVRGMQCIKLFGREESRTLTWQNLTVAQFNASVRTQRLRIVYQALNGALFGVENVITIWLGALLVLDTSSGAGFSIGMLFAFVAYKTQFIQRIAALVEKSLELRMLGLHTDRVGDIVLSKTESHDTHSLRPRGTPTASIEIKNVSFRYADNEPYILQNINLQIAEGESVAIVGPSGCGKTTLTKLMLGLLQPTDGTIEIGGMPLAQFGMTNFRAITSSVMQDDQLFAGSIAENICFFDPQPDHERIAESAQLASVSADINAMPMQFNTLVGDMGTVLSGGQKQRILLARALYRKPKFLFLDEATSHLDIARERNVNAAIKALKLTRIIVAHRQETIASADRVIVMSGGRVVSQMGVIDGHTNKGEVLLV